jgi:hypothetical protein
LTQNNHPLPRGHLRQRADQLFLAGGGINGQDHAKNSKTCLGGRSRPAACAQVRRSESSRIRIAQDGGTANGQVNGQVSGAQTSTIR